LRVSRWRRGDSPAEGQSTLDALIGLVGGLQRGIEDTEALAPAAECLASIRQRDAEVLGNLVAGMPMNDAQEQRRALAWGQPQQDAIEPVSPASLSVPKRRKTCEKLRGR